MVEIHPGFTYKDKLININVMYASFFRFQLCIHCYGVVLVVPLPSDTSLQKKLQNLNWLVRVSLYKNLK